MIERTLGSPDGTDGSAAPGGWRLDPAPGPDPRWLKLVRQVHDSVAGPAPVVADAVILAAIGLALRMPAVTVAGLSVLVPLTLGIGRHYQHRSPLETQGISWYPARVVAACAIATVVLLAVPGPLASTGRLGLYGLIGCLGLVASRSVTWTLLSTARRNGRGQVATAVLGTGEQVERVVNKLRSYPEAGLRPVRILEPYWAGTADQEPYGPAEAGLLLRSRGVGQLIVVPDGNPDQELSRYLEHLHGVDVAVVPPLAELFLAGRRVIQVGGLPLVPFGRSRPWSSTPLAKRVFDLVVSAALLLLVGPVLLAAALAIKVTSGGPILYRQRRVGHRGRDFEVLKLRTMTTGADQVVVDLRDRNCADGPLFKIRDDPRVLPVGRLLRRTSIDELPQLVNVLRGEMSLVGPRPLAVEPEVFGTVGERRHSVLPGITGYWQVCGGSGLTYREMIQLDLAYIQGWSLWLDLVLLAKTVPAVVNRRGPW